MLTLGFEKPTLQDETGLTPLEACGAHGFRPEGFLAV